MSEENNYYEEDKKVGIGYILKTINNIQGQRNESPVDSYGEKQKPITLKNIQENKEILQALERAEMVCKEMDIIKHGKKHAEYVSKTSGEILSKLGFPDRIIQLVEITGYLHDLGYRLDIEKHAFISAGMAYEILKRMDMSQDEIDKICLAIAYHHNQQPVNTIGAALIIAEISDFSCDRVREGMENDPIAQLMLKCISRELIIEEKERIIKLILKIDFRDEKEKNEFIENSKSKHVYCIEAAEFLGCKFQVFINDEMLLNLY